MSISCHGQPHSDAWRSMGRSTWHIFPCGNISNLENKTFVRKRRLKHKHCKSKKVYPFHKHIISTTSIYYTTSLLLLKVSCKQYIISLITVIVLLQHYLLFYNLNLPS